MRVLLLPAVLLLAAAPQKDSVPDATPTGEAESCINIRSIQSSRVRSDRVIDFEMNGGKVYRNELPMDCPGLGFEKAFSYVSHTGQLCSVDTITVLRQGPVSSGATCGLGKFQPVKLVKAH